MPKGRSGHGGSSKKPTQLVANEENSNVVFGDPNTPSKTKKAQSSDGQDKNGLNPPVNNEDVTKRPDTRKLIGGASWTGKLPVNMLSEHCQKQRWAKPEYTMTKTSDGFSSMVILKATNPKTRETVGLPPFKLPSSLSHLAIQPTAVEARHFAATYALFRVCSMRNIHMMLPPTYRDLWKKEFHDLKIQDVKEGKGWMYEADPFAAKHEREEAQALMAKKREEREKHKAQHDDKLVTVFPTNGSRVSSGSRGDKWKGWTRVPKLEMGKRTRADIEDLVRRRAIWNIHCSRPSEFQRRNIINELSQLGFRRSHVEEAVGECKDREETIEWLLIHVPEDDLPSWSLPEGYSAGVSMASSNMKREASLKRLAEPGYSIELCARMYDAYNGDEDFVAEALQQTLNPSLEGVEPHDLDMAKLSIAAAEGESSIWVEEQETLEAIFGERFTRIATNLYHIQMHVSKSSASFTLGVRKSSSYPSKPPVISILSPGLASYIRLSIIRQSINHAARDFCGEPMVFNIVDWLENEIFRIIESPGKLREVSAATSDHRNAMKAPNPEKALPRQNPPSRNLNNSGPQNLELSNRWRTQKDSPQQQKMLRVRQSLPAWNLRDAIVTAVNNHQVTIISGETGSGKSTQSVQFILDDMINRRMGAAANIVCTQPRRISALGLADRVSDERCSPVGEEIGYAIRGESKRKAGITKVTFMTTGVLLRRLQTSGGSQDDVMASLADISHVFLDEVHERSLDTDFLLVLLRDVLRRRKDLKVILMSATLDAGIFEKYFDTSSAVGKIEIQGRTFPVEDYYLDDVIRLTGFSVPSRNGTFTDGADDADSSVANKIQSLGMRINYDLIASTVRAIDSQLAAQEGGILIFLPGVLEINRTLDALRNIPNLHALPLHASLLSSEQRRVFAPPLRGKRKVIAATNVAETSITIEDIVAVIDCGKVKETSFDPQSNMVKLEEVWASRAACKQRRGRAGRVQAGICYKLYTQNAEAKMAERPEPEIRRVPLEQLCLSVRAMGVVDVPGFLASALTPPESLAVEGALELLQRMGALDNVELTALGRHLSMIPADLRCGKLMVYGATFGCFEACLTIAAMLTVRSPFVSPQGKRDESKAARTSFAPGHGDLICDLKAYEEWSKQKSNSNYRDLRTWCEQNYLSSQTLSDIVSNRSQYLSSLKEAGFLRSDYRPGEHDTINSQGSNLALIRALVAGAFNPQLARIDFPDRKFAPSMSGAIELDPEARTIKYFNQENGRVFVHPSSTLFDAQGFVGGSVYMSYFNKMATSKVFIREMTPFNAYSLLLFSGPIVLDTLGRGLLVDGWLRLRGWARIGVLVSRLRTMLDEVLARKIDDPSLDLRADEVLDVVRRLVEYDGLDR